MGKLVIKFERNDRSTIYENVSQTDYDGISRLVGKDSFWSFEADTSVEAVRVRATVTVNTAKIVHATFVPDRH